MDGQSANLARPGGRAAPRFCRRRASLHGPAPPAHWERPTGMSEAPMRKTVVPVTSGGKAARRARGGRKERATSSKAATMIVPSHLP